MKSVNKNHKSKTNLEWRKVKTFHNQLITEFESLSREKNCFTGGFMVIHLTKPDKKE